jgi:hypothetical protein
LTPAWVATNRIRCGQRPTGACRRHTSLSGRSVCNSSAFASFRDKRHEMPSDAWRPTRSRPELDPTPHGLLPAIRGLVFHVSANTLGTAGDRSHKLLATGLTPTSCFSPPDRHSGRLLSIDCIDRADHGENPLANRLRQSRPSCDNRRQLGVDRL